MRGHDRRCAGNHPVGEGGARRRPAALWDFRGVQSSEPHDRIHAVRHRWAEIQAAAPLELIAPGLVGSTFVLSFVLDLFGVPAFLPSQWANPFLHSALTGVCWVLLGIAMMDQRREPQPTGVI